MKRQKLQFVLTSLHNLQKKLKTNEKKQKKNCPTVIIKANRKILTQISKCTKFFSYYIVFIINSNDSRYTPFLKKEEIIKKEKEIIKKKKAENSYEYKT